MRNRQIETNVTDTLRTLQNQLVTETYFSTRTINM